MLAARRGFAIALEKSAARHAASRTASASFDGKLSSCDRMTTWLPGHPAACSHQSAPSRYRKSQLSRSLSLARLPTRISTPLSLAKALYGRRGAVLDGPFFFLGPRGWRGGGASRLSLIHI